jgi:predicted nucleic acid-binding protein
MEPRIFLDTTIFIYAFSDDPATANKGEIARDIVGEPFEISVQVLNEFANVARRKFDKEWAAIESLLSDIVYVSNVIHPLILDVHLKGIRLSKQHGFQLYDAMLIASALKAGCDIFASEDMQDGMVIENRLTIRNPFA